MTEVWFWQRIVSPHMAGLAMALADEGCAVTYIAEQEMSPDRRALGWSAPQMRRVNLRYVRGIDEVADCVSTAGSSSVHLCQGVRANGLIADAQKDLNSRGLQHWVIMETVDDSAWRGAIKRAIYSVLFKKYRARIGGVLAVGHQTSEWIISRGIPQARVYPFAYFLRDRSRSLSRRLQSSRNFRFAFVGQFIERKRLPMLIDALASLPACTADLVIVGSGSLEQQWRAFAEQRLSGRVRWVGALSSAAVLDLLEEVDCLVLPSRFDGWGAVVSEALMSGTPAICSDSCGAAGVVLASEVGGVFARDDFSGLVSLLTRAVATGPITAEARAALAKWASSLGARAGANYLLAILAHAGGSGPRPVVPWVLPVPT